MKRRKPVPIAVEDRASTTPSARLGAAMEVLQEHNPAAYLALVIAAETTAAATLRELPRGQGAN